MAIFDRKDDYLYVRWAKAVKNRDFHCCQICGITGGDLHSHHLNAWSSYPDQRYDIENGVTLCSGCHDRFHNIYGRGENTAEEYYEFEKLYTFIYKASKKKQAVEQVREGIIKKIRDGYSG